MKHSLSAQQAQALLSCSENFKTKSETALDLFKEIKKIHGFDEPQGHCKVAINNDLVQWDAKIEDGDKILFFPPVSGG